MKLSPQSIALLTLLAVTHAPAQLPGESWLWQNPLPQGNSLQTVAQTAGGLVTCGRSGTILTSSDDGQSWILRDSKVTSYLRRLAVDGTTIVAVGRDGAITRSTDSGASWEAAASGTFADLRFILQLDGQWVAGGDDTIVTSADGLTWTATTGATSLFDIQSMAVSESEFVALGRGNSGTETARSTDGTTWIISAAPSSSDNIKSTVWTGSSFVAITSPAGRLTSPDGVTWSRNPLNITRALESLVWTGTRFIASDFDNIYTSSDAISWALQLDPSAGTLSSIVADGDDVLAVGDFGTLHQSTDGGLSWTTRDSGTEKNLNQITRTTTDGWVVTGADGTILTSADGSAWSASSSGATLRMRGVAESGGQWIAVGRQDDSGEGAVLLSDDGTDWTEAPSPPATSLYAVKRIGSLWLATGSGEVYTSPDGQSWTTRALTGFTEEVRAIAMNGSRIAIAGGIEDDEDTKRQIHISDDGGATWSLSHNEFGGFLRGITWTGSQFIAVGDFGIVVTSPTGDAGSWTISQVPGSTILRAIASADGLLVAVGGRGFTDDADRQIYTSPDAVTWTERSAPVSTVLYSVAKADTQWIISGYDGTVLTSPNGITWTERETGTDHELYAIAQTPTGLITVGEDGTILASTASGGPGTGDTDGDGLNDLLEAYFGTSPTTPNPSPLVVLADGTAITWPEPSPASFTAVAEWSPDLATWLASGESAPGIPARTITISSPAAGQKQATLNAPAPASAHLRLKVTSSL